MLGIVLASLLFLREPRLQRYDEKFLHWLLQSPRPVGGTVPLTIVEIGKTTEEQKKAVSEPAGASKEISPLEHALFLQAALEFKPTVVGFEPILQWSARNKDQEQIFVDQAMRVPKLLVAAELTSTPDLDAPVVEIPGFPQVTGKRGDSGHLFGIGRQPEEDIRLIMLGFSNLPGNGADDIHMPLLFQYRGEVIPSFALQATLLWMRITPAETRLSWAHIIFLPNGKKIPIRSDGTALINPNDNQTGPPPESERITAGRPAT